LVVVLAMMISVAEMTTTLFKAMKVRILSMVMLGMMISPVMKITMKSTAMMVMT
jgi:hypothetical protein